MKKTLLIAALFCLVAGSVYAACTPVTVSYLTATSGGLAPMTTDDNGVWTWNSTYTCGYGTAYNKGLATGYTAHLFTPEFDFSDAESVTISFDHAHKFGGSSNLQQDYTLWVTSDYKGSFAASTWKQLTIPTYGTNDNWKYVNASIDVPKSYLGSKTVFALQYYNGSPTGTWQVKNLSISSTCSDGQLASPVPLPELGDGRLRVFAQNLRNYYFHYDNYESDRANYDHAAFAKKTRQIVDVLMMTNADIFAFCEIEAQPEVLVQLADSMNKRVEGEPYVAASPDVANEEWNATYDNNMKSGFIYNSKTVKPYGSNLAAATANYYKNTQRIQAFEELASKERFTIVMNHFKAKDSSEDQGNSTRVMNANNLVTSLKSKAADPDILILGDMNSEKGEEPITLIENAGYEEQILKYASSAFSHCYYSTPNLIDHAFANASLANYITGAGVFHICTSCWDGASANYNYRYSDHDACMVAINLPMKQPGECEDIDATYLQSDFTGMTTDAGVWYWNSGGYAKAQKQGGYTDYMMTPEMDLAEMQSVSLSFEHTHKFAGTPSEELTLWVTPNYQGSVASSTWQQLTIPTYAANTNWTFVSNTIDVPTSMVGKNTVFAFKYMSTTSNYATWEIRNLNIKAVCKKTGTDINQTEGAIKAQKTIENGTLYITLPDGSKYNVIGIRIR